MWSTKSVIFVVAVIASIAAVVGFVAGRNPEVADQAADATSTFTEQFVTTAHAQEQTTSKVSPVKVKSDRPAYYPGSETLAEDEMRIIALGTGMPNPRPSQKAACWLVELGNGDKFLFDLGGGSNETIAALEIPYDYLNKVFISHLHTDHFGDLALFYVSSWLGGRQVPLRVWGPSGPEARLGTAYALEHLQEMIAWDLENRNGRLPEIGRNLEVNEFDYKALNEVIYHENNVMIRSWPAIHGLDGSVSFSLEWKGLRFVFSGDTYPNKWFVEYAKGADVVVHEAFIAIPQLVEKYNWNPDLALQVGTQIHTAPPAAGKVFSMVKPRLAIAYHFFNDFDTLPDILDGIRSTYDGPLSMADDMLVWNVTRDKITVREVVHQDDVWPPPAAQDRLPVDESKIVRVSDEINAGKLDVSDVIQAIYDRTNEVYGTNLKPGNY